MRDYFLPSFNGGKSLNSSFDNVAYFLRARHAVLGAGSLAVRRNGSTRFLTSEIPGTRFRAIVRETPQGTVAAFLPRRKSSSDINIDSLDGMVRFMCGWDMRLMRDGIGASYFPVAALEFVDALIHDERRLDLLSVRPGTEAAAGFTIIPEGEWKPTHLLEELVRAYADDETAGPCARQSAWDLADFITHGEDKPFDAMSWERLSAVRALRNPAICGREVPSPTGAWREVLVEGAVRCASRYLSDLAPRPKIAARAMATHLGLFARNHHVGGCDFYILWNRDEVPIAIGAVSADGDIAMVDTPAARRAGFRVDVEPLLDAAGNGLAGRPSRARRHARR